MICRVEDTFALINDGVDHFDRESEHYVESDACCDRLKRSTVFVILIVFMLSEVLGFGVSAG